MIHVETHLEPPLPDLDEDDAGLPSLTVHVAFREPDSTRRAGIVFLPASASDGQIADALVATVRAVAVLRPGLIDAVESRLRTVGM